MIGRYRLVHALGWLTALLLLALLPLLAAWWQAPPVRERLIEFGVSLGLIGLGLFLVQALTSGRLTWVAANYGTDNLAHFHRHLGLFAVLFVLARPLLLMIARPEWTSYLDPRVDWMRATSLWTLLLALLMIIISSQWRSKLGLSYEHWRALHGLLAVIIIVLGSGHALMVDHYLTALWQKALLVVMAAAGVGLVAWTRLVRPWLLRRRPWQVESVRPERGGARTVVLTPIGHQGLRFLPGQFAWFSFGDSPFTLQQHPFSLAGSTSSGQICFTADEVGDFTASLKHLEKGDPAWVEGPFGAFIPDPDPDTALLLVAGGIGVTPFASLLRSFRDRGLSHRVLLVYANPRPAQAALAEELEELCTNESRELVHVLEHPPFGWQGATGQIDRGLLQRCLDRLSDHNGPLQVMTCGPEPMMDIVEVAMREQGISWQRIYAERFEIV
ncbi:MAG: ferric reductase-like transmembrane domain-containing protein [Wenzhouxiangella sp.]|nr:ferric reductase-like transmembrane domain-containing protein [Wenzhouxiangella sp.]